MSALQCIKKGSLTASFFLFCAFSAVVEAVDKGTETVAALQFQANRLNLASDPVWLAFLHNQKGRSYISDGNFFLSGLVDNPHVELMATIENLFAPDSKVAIRCRYPARYLWLSAKLNLKQPDTSACHEFEQFKAKVPFDDLSLVYASENISSPASMMGHVFLRSSGLNDKRDEVSHAISYFTEIDSLNFVKLFYETVVVGKPGYFVVSPYNDPLIHYTKTEQRNIWEYQLKASDFDKALIQAHIWELRNVGIDYFFDKNNCATVTLFLVSIANPRLQTFENKSWTPLDVVKAADHEEMIGDVITVPAYKWMVRTLQEMQRKVPQDDRIETLLARSASSYRYSKGVISRDEWLDEQDKTEGAKRYVLDVGAYRTPTKRPQESQVRISLQPEQSRIKVGYLPASHGIEDDNRNYFGDTEVKLFETAIAYDYESSKVELDKFVLYSMKSLLPYDPVTRPFSGQVRVAYEEQIAPEGSLEHGFNLVAGGGYTVALGADVSFFALLNGGYKQLEKAGWNIEPQIGLIVSEVFDMKTVLSSSYYRYGNGREQGLLKLAQNVYIRQNSSFHLTLEQAISGETREKRLEFTFKYLF